MKRISSLYRRKAIYAALFLMLVCGTAVNAQNKKQLSSSKGYGKATYVTSSTAKFMKDWLLLGPIPVDPASKSTDLKVQEQSFDQELITSVVVQQGKALSPVTVNGKPVQWQPYTSGSDVIDLDAVYNQADYASAYALAEIKSDADRSLYLALGSDDGVKVWLNGKLVHRNWTPRGAVPDEDVVPINIVKGSNQILLKVQDMQQGWGFVARLLDASDRLIIASGKGDRDMVNQLLKDGANPNKKGPSGLTALSLARLQGRKEVEELLLKANAQDLPLPAPEILIDELYSGLKSKVAPGVSVLVAKDGKIVYKKAFGYQNIEQKIAATPETKFRIGSITKQFTAAAILKLQEEGKLKVTDKLSQFLPDFPRGNEVTIHHLLTHTSGIHSYTGKSDFLTKVLTPITPDALIEYFKNDAYDFNPGEEYRYNNSGYFLLGYIIEKVSGKPYAQFLKENFFGPLQMSNTGVHNTSLKLTNEAVGYERNGESYKPGMNWDMSWAGGAGALYSTVEDMYKWNEAVFSGKVLTQESLKAAFTPVVLNNGKTPPGTNYGYGWGIDEYRGRNAIQHSGGLHGFISNAARFTEDNMTVVILTNISPPEMNLNPYPIAEYYLYDKMKAQPSYSVKDAGDMNVKAYEGRYDFGNGMVMTFTSKDNNLFAQLTGQPNFPVFPAGPDEFFWKVVEARIKFIRDEKGQVTAGDFVQGSFKIKTTKLPEQVYAKVDPTIYAKYSGRYDFGNSIVVTISTMDGKIYAQATNQPLLELMPLSEKEFAIREMNGKVTFATDDDGKVNKFVLDMAGQKRDIMKIE
jgi:CubicO group peptidase (beta-lactamase class C family)